MSSRRTNNIEVLSEWLGFLQITKEALSEQVDTEMSTAPAPANKNIQVVMPKNIVLDSG